MVLQRVATSTTTFSSLGAEENLPWDIIETPLFDLDSIPYEFRSRLDFSCRVRVDILDSTNKVGSYKFRNPEQSQYGYFHAGVDNYIRDYQPLRWDGQEFWYTCPTTTVINNQDDQPKRLKLVATSRPWAWQNTTPGIGCISVTGQDPGAGGTINLQGGMNLGSGSLLAKIHPGPMQFREAPKLPTEADIFLALTAAEVGLPDQFRGVIFQDLTAAITIDYFCSVAIAVPSTTTYNAFLETDAVVQQYGYVCDNGLPTPLPTNPGCPPDNWGPQLAGTNFIADAFGCLSPEPN